MKDEDETLLGHGGTGLFCFMDPTRECEPSCMAFDTNPTKHIEYEGKQMKHCVVLMSLHRTGRHLPIVARALDPNTRREAPKVL